MSVSHEKCPFCPKEFRGEFEPRNVNENAFLLCSTHVWATHGDKMFSCPRNRGKMKSFWRSDGDCSYCGSIAPEAFFAAIAAGQELVPTDKDYKVYVGGVNGQDFKFDHLNQDQMRQFIVLLTDKKLNMPEPFYVRPFFIGQINTHVPPPVDRTARQLLDGSPVTEDHREIQPSGMQKNYVVLSPEERQKGFVRPVRRSYIHVGTDATWQGNVLVKHGANGCGTRTTMGLALAETYARDPEFYSGTFCCGCQKHLPLDQFVWDGTKEGLGT